MSSLTFDQWFTRIKAYLDSLHDFCGERNKLIPQDVMKSYIRSAFGLDMRLDTQLSKLRTFVSNGEKLQKLEVQLTQLFNYNAGRFASFEKNMMDFVMDLQNSVLQKKSVILEFDIAKTDTDYQFNAIVPKMIIYDTSDFSYDYICNKMNKRIVITTATNWDADGKHSHIPELCDIDKTQVTASLSKQKQELSTLQYIEATKNNITVYFDNNKTDGETIDWDNIITELQNNLNVVTYTKIISSQEMRDTFRRLLRIPKGKNVSIHDIVGKVIDVKRSGDWLQLKSMIELAKHADGQKEKNYILATRDIPLAAHALSENETAMLTTSRAGLVNVRIVGTPKMSLQVKTMKIKELKNLVSTLQKSWVITCKPKSQTIQQINVILECLLKTIFHMIKTWDSLSFVDKSAKTISPLAVYRQKLLHIVCFVIYVYLNITYLVHNQKKIANKIEKAAADMSSFMSRIKTETDMNILNQLMIIKDFLTSDQSLLFNSYDMVNILDIEILKLDVYHFVKSILQISDDFRKYPPELTNVDPRFFMTNTVKTVIDSMEPLSKLVSTSSRLSSAQFLLNQNVYATSDDIMQAGGAKTQRAKALITRVLGVNKDVKTKRTASRAQSEKPAIKLMKQLSGAKLVEANYTMIMNNINTDSQQVLNYIKLMFMLNLDRVNIGSFKAKLEHWKANTFTAQPVYSKSVDLPFMTSINVEDQIKQLVGIQSGGYDMGISVAEDIAKYVMRTWYDQGTRDSVMYIPQLLLSAFVLNPSYWLTSSKVDNSESPFFEYQVRSTEVEYNYRIENGCIEIPKYYLDIESPFMQYYLTEVAEPSSVPKKIKINIGDYFIGLLIRDVYLQIAARKYVDLQKYVLSHDNHQDPPHPAKSRNLDASSLSSRLRSRDKASTTVSKKTVAKLQTRKSSTGHLSTIPEWNEEDSMTMILKKQSTTTKKLAPITNTQTKSGQTINPSTVNKNRAQQEEKEMKKRINRSLTRILTRPPKSTMTMHNKQTESSTCRFPQSGMVRGHQIVCGGDNAE